MSQLIDDVLHLSKVSRAELRQQEVDLSALAEAILERLRESEPERAVEARVRPGVMVTGDGRLLRIALANLLENAWKFTARVPAARIEFGLTTAAGEPAYFVRDNGAGFDMTYVDRLFGPFQRLHLASEFPGSLVNGLPDDVHLFLYQNIESVEQLEVLLLLWRAPERGWTSDEVATAVYSHPSSVVRRLAMLLGQGLLREREPGCYQYAPRTADSTARVAVVPAWDFATETAWLALAAS